MPVSLSFFINSCIIGVNSALFFFWNSFTKFLFVTSGKLVPNVLATASENTSAKVFSVCPGTNFLSNPNLAVNNLFFIDLVFSVSSFTSFCVVTSPSICVSVISCLAIISFLPVSGLTFVSTNLSNIPGTLFGKFSFT